MDTKIHFMVDDNKFLLYIRSDVRTKIVTKSEWNGILHKPLQALRYGMNFCTNYTTLSLGKM